MSLPPESMALRARAAKLLDLPAEATAAEARSAFLKRLARVDWAPPDAVRAGLGLLDESAAKSPSIKHAVAGARRDLLTAEVDQFIEEFWRLAPAARRQRWEALWEIGGEQANVIAHLKHLEGGLDVVAGTANGLPDRPAQIAQFIEQTFPLRSLERTARRQEWLVATAGQPALWQRAANELNSAAPDHAKLDGALIKELLARADRKIRPVKLTPRLRPPRPIAKDKSGIPGWAIYLVVAIAFSALRGLISLSTDQPTPAPTPRFDYRVPDSSEDWQEKPPATSAPFSTTPDRPLDKEKEKRLQDILEQLRSAETGSAPSPSSKPVQPPPGGRP